MTAPDPLSVRQREIVTQATETLCLTAAAIAAGMRGVDLNSREDVYRAAYTRAKVRLAGVLAVLDEVLADRAEDTRMVGEVRGALSMLTWDLSGHTISPISESPQRVLGAIERIVGGER